MAEPTSPASARITAIVTAYHPDERLPAVVESALADCAEVIVSDNTPGGASLAEKLDHPRVTVLRNGRNLGLGGALNRALEQLPPRDPEDHDSALLLLDQDSVLPPGLVRGLVVHLAADPGIGIVAPTPWDEAHDAYYSSTAGLHSGLSDRHTVITSGMLLRRSAQEATGPFREDFFVDFIDIDFCLRLRRTGARIVQDWESKLPHSMGDRREHRIGPVKVRVTHYPAWRHYWIARNSLRVNMDNVRTHPGAFLPTARYLTQRFAASVCFMAPRGRQAMALARGVRDGLTGHTDLRYLPDGAELTAPVRGG